MRALLIQLQKVKLDVEEDMLAVDRCGVDLSHVFAYWRSRATCAHSLASESGAVISIGSLM